MALALTLSVSVLIMSSYAWMVLSSNPAATGIQVIIGGGNTILVAPNIEQTVDGKTYSIPGHFSDKMNFGAQDSYKYLSGLAGLTPVSTSNGIDWFVSGSKTDSFLLNANVQKYIGEGENKTLNPKIGEGNYIYLDFWVVSPSGNYDLRISTGAGTSEGGSFVIDLPNPQISEDENGIKKGTLSEEEGKSAAASVRIGFLANPVAITDETMNVYQQSPYKDTRFKGLRGLYMEPGTGAIYIDSEKFTIYEPNGDYHPLSEELDGRYVQTKPLMIENEEVRENPDIWDNLTVQLKSDWYSETEGGQKLVEQFLNKGLLDGYWGEKIEKDPVSAFYGAYLQGQLSPYVNKGEFITRTGALEAAQVNENNSISIEGLGKSGATEDVVIIELEQNVPQRIRMFIWLEGQDIDCPASANSAVFAVSIELAGGTKE